MPGRLDNRTAFGILVAVVGRDGHRRVARIPDGHDAKNSEGSPEFYFVELFH